MTFVWLNQLIYIEGELFNMRIGIDLDGVVIDSETTFRVYEELYDLIDSSLIIFILPNSEGLEIFFLFS